MDVKKVLQRIEQVRKSKDYSHEYMAHCLDISQAAYSKIERNQTKLSVERMFKIADILELKLEDLLEIEAKNQFNQTNKENVTAYLQQTANFYQENKEQLQKIIDLYEERIKDKEQLIGELQDSLKQLRGSN